MADWTGLDWSGVDWTGSEDLVVFFASFSSFFFCFPFPLFYFIFFFFIKQNLIESNTKKKRFDIVSIPIYLYCYNIIL